MILFISPLNFLLFFCVSPVRSVRIIISYQFGRSWKEVVVAYSQLNRHSPELAENMQRTAVQLLCLWTLSIVLFLSKTPSCLYCMYVCMYV
jgi:hypothetical protein